MSRTFHRGERRIRVQGIRNDPPDLRRVARALIALAQAQAEAEAQQSKATKNSNPAAATRTADPDTAPKQQGRRGDAA